MNTAPPLAQSASVALTGGVRDVLVSARARGSPASTWLRTRRAGHDRRRGRLKRRELEQHLSAHGREIIREGRQPHPLAQPAGALRLLERAELGRPCRPTAALRFRATEQPAGRDFLPIAGRRGACGQRISQCTGASHAVFAIPTVVCCSAPVLAVGTVGLPKCNVWPVQPPIGSLIRAGRACGCRAVAWRPGASTTAEVLPTIRPPSSWMSILLSASRSGSARTPAPSFFGPPGHGQSRASGQRR